MLSFISATQNMYKANGSKINEVITYLQKKKVISIDTETNGLDWRSKKIIMFQIGDYDRQFVIDTRTIDISLLKPILESKSILKIGHNIKFDYKFILSNYNIRLENVYDTMLAERVLTCGLNLVSYDLATVCKKYTNVSLDKEVRKRFNKSDSSPFTTAEIEYGAKDVKYLEKIREKQLEKAKELDVEYCINLENSVTLALADIEYNGIKLNKDAWVTLAKKIEEERNHIAEELDLFIEKNPRFSQFLLPSYQLGLFGQNERKVAISWASTEQVLNVLKIDIPQLESTSKFELLKYKTNELVSKVLEFREKERRVTAYGKAFLKHVSKDTNRVHTEFWQILDTGRISSGSRRKGLSFPNMQNIPAENEYRNCFIAEDTYSIISVDYSGQELRIITAGSKDPVWSAAIAANQDLHSVCAELVFGKKWKDAAENNCAYYNNNKSKCNCKEHKRLRTQVKTINFGLAYGMSEYKLSDTLSISISEAKQLINRYFSVFPNIKDFLEALGRYGLTNGFIRTYRPCKRIRWFGEHSLSPEKEHLNGKTQAEINASIIRKSKNTPIQGTGADMVKLALVLLRNKIRDNNLWDKVKLITQVHDEIGVEVKDEIAKWWAETQSQLMELAGKEFITTLPMEVDYTISKKWEK